MTSPRNDQANMPERPALVGELGQYYEEPVIGGGSQPKGFASPAETKEVFSRGVELLSRQLTRAMDEHRIPATIAQIRLHSRATAKSHRHSTLYDRIQVAGVQRPGRILALVTHQNLQQLSELVTRGSQNQLVQLSSVAEITPYEAPVEHGETSSVVSLFDGRLDDGTSLQARGLEHLTQRGVSLKPYGKAQGVYSTSSMLSREQLQYMPWLRRVRPAVRFRPVVRFGVHPVLPQNMPTAVYSLPLPIVGVVDSGLDPSIPWLQALTAGRETYIPSTHVDYRHGSLVGALAATGGGFTPDPQNLPSPSARLLDVQVMGSGDYDGINEEDLIVCLEHAVEKYGPRSTSRPPHVDQPVVIWNLSLGGGSAARTEEFSDMAMELDRIAQQNGVIFTVAAGNYVDQPLRGWTPGVGPDVVANGDDRITPPADSALGVSVGSLSDTSNPPTASPAEYPSPFSRRGPGPGMLVKPDVVHYGGTCGKFGQHVGGIFGPYRNGMPMEAVGTSFAAPRVAAQLAQLVEVLPNPEPELLKLLLLLSCTSRGDCDLDARDKVNYYGFGVPERPAAILSCNSWDCTILLRGELRPGRTLQTPVPFPSSLESQGTRRGSIRVALVYSPTLDSSKGSEYCQTNVTASLGREIYNPRKKVVEYRREVPPIPQTQGTRVQFETDLIEHGWKWSPTKVYERTFTKMRVTPNERGWRLGLELLLRRELEDQRENVRQPFWLGIRIADPDRKSQVYQEISQQVQASALAQPILLLTQIRS